MLAAAKQRALPEEGEIAGALSLSDFLVEKELARTAAGSVYRAKHGKSGRTVVLKARRSAEIGRDGSMEHEVSGRRRLLLCSCSGLIASGLVASLLHSLPLTLGAAFQVHLLQSLNHPNIIKCYGSFWSHPGGTFHMVLEFADGGDLATLIANTKRHGETLHEEKIWQLWLPIMHVASYLHEKGIIHRDIKALNVFMKANKIKVGDFGVGRVMSENTLMVDTMYGTPLYLSPELCQNEPYNAKTDIWSCGVLLYELCSLETPFPGKLLPYILVNPAVTFQSLLQVGASTRYPARHNVQSAVKRLRVCTDSLAGMTGRNLIELSKNICAGKMKPVPGQYSKLMKRAISALLERDQKTRPSANRFLDWYKSAREYIREAESAGRSGGGANGEDIRPSDGVRDKIDRPGPYYLERANDRNREHEQEMESDHDRGGHRRREQVQEGNREERLERERESAREWDGERLRRRDGDGDGLRRGSDATLIFQPAQRKLESERASLNPKNDPAKHRDPRLGKERQPNISPRRDAGARRETGKQERAAEQSKLDMRPHDEGRLLKGEARGKHRGAGEHVAIEHAGCNGEDARGDEGRRKSTDGSESCLHSFPEGGRAQSGGARLAGANRPREQRPEERYEHGSDLIIRVASDPGLPSPIVQREYESRQMLDRDVPARDALEWDRDRDRNRAGGRTAGGLGARILPLQLKGGAGAPWDDRPPSGKSDSVASSASQRDALLSGAWSFGHIVDRRNCRKNKLTCYMAARRQLHFQRRQEGRKGEVRCIDAANDRGINARSGPHALVLTKCPEFRTKQT